MAVVWLPDSYARRCLICKDSFTMVRRRHHCRGCGKLVCGRCSGYRLAMIGYSKLQRTCTTCFVFYQFTVVPLESTIDKIHVRLEGKDGPGYLVGHSKSIHQLVEQLHLKKISLWISKHRQLQNICVHMLKALRSLIEVYDELSDNGKNAIDSLFSSFLLLLQLPCCSQVICNETISQFDEHFTRKIS